MTDEETAFIDAIGDQPGDRVLRLVYADWLDERGDPRGEYLRLGCRLEEVARGLDPAWVAAVRDERSRGNDIRLRSGRLIRLDGLRQSRTYGGWLEGVPTTEGNREMIDELLARERERPLGGEPYLIRPTETPIELDRGYPFGTPARLPGVACVAKFWCTSPARDPDRDVSSLTVVWFQDGYALPIDPRVWEELTAIDWERHAVDGDY